MQPRVAVFDPQQIRTKGVTLFVVFCFVVIIKLGIGVGFSPAAMMDRAINPREYTEVRAGLGPLFHIHLGLKYVLITLATVMVFASGKSFFSIIFFMMCVGVTLIGGTKASFVLPVIVSVVVWQKISWQYRSVFQKFRKTILIGVLVVAVVILSFALWGASGEVTGIGDAISGIVGYLKEAYYLPLVTEAFPWSPKVLSDVIADTFISPIPRAIWKNKPSKGLWSQYFRPTFEPNTVYYHTSTFGCLSEAHMLYGRLGPFVYGILWALICYKLYVYMISHDSLFKACFVAVICQWTYLLVRTGFLGVNTSTIALYMLISWFILRNTKVIYSEETEYDEYSVSELPQESYQEQYYQEHVE
ncbi:MAG: hypothetical protein KAJ07_01245 [Planctomycetes bacterium]|nr:hypothetical protein [Planctomycetota bacterium]